MQVRREYEKRFVEMLRILLSRSRGRLLLVVSAMMLFASPFAHAAGSCSSTPAMPYLQPMNNMAVSTSLPVGSAIPGTVKYFTFSGQCVSGGNATIYPGAQIVSCYYGSGTEVMSGVYTTGVAGIGIRLRNSAGQPMVNAAGVSCDTRAAGLGTLNPDLSYSVTVSVEFVKTGSIIGGNLDPGQTKFGFGVYSSGVGLGGESNYIGFTGSAAPRAITCSVNYPATVMLPSPSATALRPAGRTTGTTSFSIGLTCDSAAQVGITFDAAVGTPIQSASTGVLGASNAGQPGAATGVGFQLVNGGTYSPVPLQVRNDLGSIAANTLNNYNYAVRYIGLNGGQLATAGEVISSAIFTFDYQ